MSSAPGPTLQVRSPMVGRERRNLDLIEPRDVVSLGPHTEPAGNKLAVVKRGQHPSIVQPNCEFVASGGNFQGLPLVSCYVGVNAGDSFRHAADDMKQR